MTGTIRLRIHFMSVTQRLLPRTPSEDTREWTQENPALLNPRGSTQTAKGGLASPAPSVSLNASYWQNEFTPEP